jgi:hypothetical protein
LAEELELARLFLPLDLVCAFVLGVSRHLECAQP